MEFEKAKEIITSLANGIDPVTGEVFPKDSPYNHPEIIRALFFIINELKAFKKPIKLSLEEKQAQNQINGRPRNAGLPWTDLLKKELADLFADKKSINELALHFERTEGSILSELVHQGLIDRNDLALYRQ